jgi:hypothetical protein
MLLSMHNASSNTVSQTSVSTFHGPSNTSLKEMLQRVFAPPVVIHEKAQYRMQNMKNILRTR